jgi:hypothetical protein
MSGLIKSLIMPEESATMAGRLEGKSIDINKTWLRLMRFLGTYKIKALPFPCKQ